ncbi:MAG TPA: hypothetical protein VIA06_09765 [Candidatus Dormibacteraeota bacterium]|jgi:hypothetical protein|nr:hypothetical protein [Candidatus Dormibacteraeota bacterium]
MLGGKGPPISGPLQVTLVQLATADFLTDRGPRPLPAWLFSFEGARGAAPVLAIAAPAIFSVRRSSPLPSFVLARLSSDERTLTVDLFGAKAGTGPGTAGYSMRVAASSTAIAVAIDVQTRGEPALSWREAEIHHERHVTTVLPTPIGHRVVVDAVSWAPVAAIVK